MEDSDWIKNYDTMICYVSNDTEHHCDYNFTDKSKKYIYSNQSQSSKRFV